MSRSGSKNNARFQPLVVKEDGDGGGCEETEIRTGLAGSEEQKKTKKKKKKYYYKMESRDTPPRVGTKPILPANLCAASSGKKATNGHSNNKVEYRRESTSEDEDEEEGEENGEDGDNDDDDDDEDVNDEGDSGSYEDSEESSGESGEGPPPASVLVGKAVVGSCGPRKPELVKVHSLEEKEEPFHDPTWKAEDKDDSDSKKSLKKMPSVDFKSLNKNEMRKQVSESQSGESLPDVGGAAGSGSSQNPPKKRTSGSGLVEKPAHKKRSAGGASGSGSTSKKSYGGASSLPPMPPTSPPPPQMVFQTPLQGLSYGPCCGSGGVRYTNYEINPYISSGCPSHSVRSVLSPVRSVHCGTEGTVYSLALEMPISGAATMSSAIRRKKHGRKKYPASLPDEDTGGCICSPLYVSSAGSCVCGHGDGGRQQQHRRKERVWTRASIERDCSVPLSSASSKVNRHSSYYPPSAGGGGNNDNAASSAADARSINRPTSPHSCSGQNMGSSGDCKTVCGDCCNRTFPRSLRNAHSCGHCHVYCSRGSIGGSLLGLDYEDRLLRLESDKDTLHLQVSCLSDQIDAQTSKIQDLEKLLDDKRNTLETTEEQLQRELVTRSGLETQKLELITEISGLRLRHATLERENLELKGKLGGSSVRSLTELNYGGELKNISWSKPPMGVSKVRDSSPHAYADPSFGGRLRLTSSTNENGQPVLHSPRMQTPPATGSRRVEVPPSYGTMPRLSHSSLPPGLPLSVSASNATVGNKLPMGPLKTNSLSSGNLHSIDNAKTGKMQNAKENSQAKGDGSHKTNKIFRIFGKLRRSNSNSGALDVEGNEESKPDGQFERNPFVRGGFRATAAPRLGWATENSPRMPDGPINAWDSNGVVNWLNYLGLGMYSNEIRRWVKSGQQLLEASTAEVEKELGIKNPLHRKKLALALYYLQHSDEEDNAGRLDYHWVTRWLDDVGLPQYKEAFGDARVDGRVLCHLTTDDLVNLKVTSLLHHASLKRGIQILRIHRFHPGCLCRRGSVSELKSNRNDPAYVSTWTNHRVMEWLKAVDLAEYAPNLRGSGVHGALIVLEPRFNAELLAALLSIPASKTLLRRHLGQQFSDLCGKGIVDHKRNVQLSTDFIPITLTSKVKVTKRAFPLRKKSQDREGTEDLVCPPELNSFPVEMTSGIGTDRTDSSRSDLTSNI